MSKLGILGRLSLSLRENRLGDLLVKKSIITASDLTHALGLQKADQRPLGQVLVAENMISRWQLASILGQQYALRTCAALLLLGVGVSILSGKRVQADGSGFMQVSASQDFARVSSYPALMETSERRDRDISAFTKWTGMFKKFDRQLRQTAHIESIREWQDDVSRYQGRSIKEMARGVNNLVNQNRYILDKNNWGKSDYWATPVEFLERGGDCEDFAIAKYAALRSLGVPEERMRVAIVQDTQKNIPHAVLVVYTNDGAYLLDNQIKSLIDAERKGRYEPIFSINRQAWWLHKKPSATMVASAR